ncbi:hypothetical protein ACLMJK_003391 [Lecanora helva]
MDEETIMEKRYGRKSPTPAYHDYNDLKTVSDALHRRPRRSIVACATAIFLTLLIITYGLPVGPLPSRQSSQFDSRPDPFASNGTRLVPLEAHIMSKCPDARDCLKDLVVPAMEQVVDKVDFRLSYIGSVDENNTIHCKHGSTECLGNMLGLCANKLYPNNTKISLGFSTCLIMSYQRIPDRDLVTQCALEHGISFDELNRCISEEGKGLDLLEASVERSEKAGVKKSCTVRVGGEQWCIRDGVKDMKSAI